MPRYLNASEGVSGKSGGGRKGKSRRNQSKEVNNNGRPKSAGVGVADGKNTDGASNFDISEVMSESGRFSVAGSLDDDVVSVTTESVFGAGGEITEDQWAALEEKLKENIDHATHKNTNIRMPALKSLEKILSSHYLPEFLENQKVTVADVVEKLLRKRSAVDGCPAVKILSLLVLQLGISCSEAVSGVISSLKSLVNDPALPEQYRADCALALGIYTFIAEEESENIVSAAESLKTAWSHIKLHSTSPETVPFFSAAIASWTFVLLQAPTKHLEQALIADLTKLTAYFESSQLEIRIAAGEAVALLYDLASDMYSEFRPPSHYHTLEQLERMSTESTKHFAKKDRRLQRASFRDIYAAVKSNDSPKLTVKFPPEVLSIDSWSSKLCYDMFCQVLSGGINVHLKENPILRETFNLGPPLPSGTAFKRMAKAERQAIANTVSKARTLIRGKQRDKRMAAF